MSNAIFHSFQFEYKGVLIPDFTIDSGKVIRLCLPNFDSNGGDLTGDFRYRLLNHFEEIIPKSKYSKEYNRRGILNFTKSMTVEQYLSNALNVDRNSPQKIAYYLKLDVHDKVDQLPVGKRKALSIKCDFEKYDLLVFDYHGVSADQIEYLESIVDVEIAKGKCAIVIDRLEFNQEIETDKNITRIEIDTT